MAATATRDGGGKVWALGFYSPGAALKMERREIRPASMKEGSGALSIAGKTMAQTPTSRPH